MQNTEIDSFTVDWEQTLMTMLEEPAVNASSLGLSDAFCREFTNVPLFGDDIDVSNDLGLQGSSSVAGPASSDVQPNEQFAPQQPKQLEQSLEATAQLPIQDESRQCSTSIASLFDAPGSPEIEVVELSTPATMTPWPVTEIPITPPTTGKRVKQGSNKIGKKATPRSKTSRITADLKNHKILNSVHLPQALATPQEYADHVSPFAPIDASKSDKPHGLAKLGHARRRVDAMTQERSQYLENLRTTSIDPTTGKTKIQTLEEENESLRRLNTTQSNTNKRLKDEMLAERKKFSELAYQYNVMFHDFHKAKQENMEMKDRLKSS